MPENKKTVRELTQEIRGQIHKSYQSKKRAIGEMADSASSMLYENVGKPLEKFVGERDNPDRPEDSAFSLSRGRTDASVVKEAKRHLNPMIGTGDKYPGTRVNNPFQDLQERRKLEGFAEHMGEKIEAGVAYQNLSEEDKKAFSAYTKGFIQSDVYKSNLSTISNDLSSRLDRIYEETRKNPLTAVTQAKWDMEMAFRTASHDLDALHQTEVKNFLLDKDNATMIENIVQEKQSKNPDYFNEMSDNMMPKEIERILDDKQPLPKDLNTLSDEQKTKILAYKEAEALFEPLHTAEKQDLSTAMDNSRQDYEQAHRDNADWARICHMQDPSVFEAAKKIQQERCAKEFDEYNKKMKSNQAQANQNATNVIGAGGYSDKVMAHMDPNALPTLADFQDALKKFPDKKFQFNKNIYVPGGDKTVITERKGGTKVTMKDGGFSIDLDVSPNHAEASAKVWDAHVNLVDTIWLADQRIPPNQRSITLDCTSPEYARVAAKAALIRGYDIKNIDIKVNGKKFEIPQDIQDKAAKFHTAKDHSAKSKISEAIDRIPRLPSEVNKISEPAEVKNIIETYEKTQYLDNTKILEEIIESGKRVLAGDDPKAEADYIKAVDKLNHIKLEEKGALKTSGEWGRWVTSPVLGSKLDNTGQKISAKVCTKEDIKRDVNKAESCLENLQKELEQAYEHLERTQEAEKDNAAASLPTQHSLT